MKDKLLPQWAPRVRQDRVRRLYESDARGIRDEDLLNEVGYGLLARCGSFVRAVEAVQGLARCPACDRAVRHHSDKSEELECECGWSLSWGEYFKTIQGKQLSGAEPVLRQFREFVERFPRSNDAGEKMILIDQLLHGFHWAQKYGPTRPVAVNLIEGRLNEVMAFLDRLTYGPSSTSVTRETFAEWQRNSGNARRWSGGAR